MSTSLDRGRETRALAVVPHRGGVSIWATWHRGDQLRRTEDGGLSWQVQRAR